MVCFPVMKVWTFIITGGTPFEVLAGETNPPIIHDGGRTLAKVVVSKPEADALLDILLGYGARVRVFTENREEEGD